MLPLPDMPRLLLTCLIFLMCSLSPAWAQQYLWPTDAGKYLSSTFGETRAAHFHAGLDIKTWGREGYRVFATRSGTVHRLAVTERGYGNAVYLKHDDGSYSLYAHLQRFAPVLQAYTDSIRLQDYSFEIDLNLDSLNWHIKQGEIIGYTGSTGVGPPHLHFELRDSLQRPFNALHTNLEVRDELAPVFNSIIVEPLEVNSRIDGRPVSMHIAARKTAENTYDFGTTAISGSVGLAINVHDIANDVPNRYAVYRLSLVQNRDTLFQHQLDYFSYDEAGANMFLDRITPFGSTRRGHQRLHKKDGSAIPFYKIALPEAAIKPNPQPVQYCIIAEDFFGNTATATITITEADPAQSSGQPLANFTLPTSDWYWHENWASPDLENTVDLRNLNAGFFWRHHQRVIFTGPNAKPHTFARINPETYTEVFTADFRLRARFSSQSFFDTLTVATNYSIEKEYVKISIQPGMLPVKTEYKVEFFLGEDLEDGRNYRLFRLNNSGRLFYVPSVLINQTIHGWPNQLGEFVIYADDEPPQIFNFKIYKTDYGQWKASVMVIDELSGINSASASFVVNGVQGIAEYDYEEHFLIYHLPGFTPKELNSAKITLSDRAGNTRTVSFEYKMR